MTEYLRESTSLLTVGVKTITNLFNFITFHNQPLLEDKFKNYKLLNKGASGIVYADKDDTESVIKLQYLCSPNTKFEWLLEICSLAQSKNLIFYLPDTISSKIIIVTLNPILEIFINKEILKCNVPFFPTIYSADYYKDNITVTKIEKLNPIIPLIKTDLDFWWLCFQVYFSLHIAQKTFKFVHGDLHFENLLSKTNSETLVFDVGNFKGFKYLICNVPWILKIIDFGYSRIENDKYIFIPRISINEEFSNYYFFNPHIDCLAFYGTLFNNRKDYKTLTYFKGAEWKKINKLLKYFVMKDLAIEDIYPLNKDNISFWRPEATLIRELNLPYPLEISHSIIEVLTTNFPDNFKLTNKENFPLIYGKISNPMNTIILPVKVIENYNFDGISIQTKKTNKKLISPGYHRETSVCNPGKQYYHTATIDLTSSKNENYTFRIDCCRQDLFDYFSSNSTSGVAINGGFFDIHGDFRPVGIYKYIKNGKSIRNIPTKDSITIDPIYRKYYGCIGIKDNKVEIKPTEEMLKNQDEYDFIVQSGPLLIYNEDVKFTLGLFKHKNKVKINNFFDSYLPLQCRKPITKAEKESPLLQVYPEDINVPTSLKTVGKKLNIFGACKETETHHSYGGKVSNCDLIAPGELSHISNPNPRSMLMVLPNKIVFVYIEGRGERGNGMDVVEMTKLAQSYGAIHAINLDGGRSSNIVWRDKDILGCCNPERTFTYPVGTIISFVKPRT